MLLSKLHLKDMAHVSGSTVSMFTNEAGWKIELHPELGGVLCEKDKQRGGEVIWIPYANCRNGYPIAEGKGR
jgi:hypothetical protein